MTIHKHNFFSIDESHGFQDFSIECCEEATGNVHIFKIHKKKVKGNSRYLDMLIDGGFQEARENCAQLQADPALVAAILWFMYGSGYIIAKSPWDGSISDYVLYLSPVTSNLQHNIFLSLIKLFHMADVWEYPKLQQVVKNAIRNRLFNLFKKKFRGYSRSDLKQLKEALNYAFENMTGLEKLWEFLVHECHANLPPSANEEICADIPELAWSLYKEAFELLRESYWGCPHCGRMMDARDAVGILVKTADNDIEVVKCSCNFRGICSENCEARENFAVFWKHIMHQSHGLSCEDCLDEAGLDFKSWFHRADTKVASGAEYAVWSHQCTDESVRWLPVGKACKECRHGVCFHGGNKHYHIVKTPSNDSSGEDSEDDWKSEDSEDSEDSENDEVGNEENGNDREQDEDTNNN